MNRYREEFAGLNIQYVGPPSGFTENTNLTSAVKPTMDRAGLIELNVHFRCNRHREFTVTSVRSPNRVLEKNAPAGSYPSADKALVKGM